MKIWFNGHSSLRSLSGAIGLVQMAFEYTIHSASPVLPHKKAIPQKGGF